MSFQNMFKVHVCEQNVNRYCDVSDLVTTEGLIEFVIELSINQ